ncbi:MAG: ABC transporter substrate-binding protein [Actinocatenispora sp.]
MLIRRPGRRLVVGLTALALAVPLAASGCSGSATSTGANMSDTAKPDNRPVRNGGTLTVALSEDPDALDPTTANTFVAREVFANFCEKLYDVNADLKIVPQLAAKLPKMSDGGKTATIALRDGIRFNDGTPFDAAAVKKSLDRDLTLPTSSRKSELGAVRSVTVVDSRTIRISMSRPFAPLSAQLADRAGMVMSPKALDHYGKNFGAHPVCVGPFKFLSRTSGNQIVLGRSTSYYDRAKVKLDKIVYKIVTDANVRSANLQSGDIQVAERVATTDVGNLTADSSLKILPGGGLGYQGLTINTANAHGATKPPGHVNTPLATHPALRKAFELSLDRNVINRVVFNGLYDPDCSPLPRHNKYRDSSLRCPTRDLARARTLVKRSGVKGPVPVSLLVSADSVSERLGQVIQAMAKEAGFAVTVRPTEFVTALNQARNGKYDVIQVGWSGRVDPDGDINDLITSGGSNNYSGLHDPVIDNAVHQAAATTDEAERTRLYRKAMDRERQITGLIYLYHERYFLGTSAQIAGIRYYADGIPRFTSAGYAK